MNGYSQSIEQLKDVAEFAVWVALLLVPAVSAVKSRVAQVKGWITLAVTFGLAALISAALLRPTTGSAVWDTILAALTATVIASGGDAYVLRILTKAKSTSVLKVPVQTESFDVREQPTKPDIKLKV